MAGYMKKAMSYLGMTDVVDDDDEDMQDDEDTTSGDFDSESSVTPITMQTSSTSRVEDSSSSSSAKPFPASRINRITTIHPKDYDEVQKVGRALRDGVPVVLNLTGLSREVACRALDFCSGVVFGIRGSLERVTSRVFLLSPSQVKIKVEQSPSNESEDDLF